MSSGRVSFGDWFNFDFIYGAFVYLKISNNRIGRFVSVVNQHSAFGFEFNFSGNDLTSLSPMLPKRKRIIHVSNAQEHQEYQSIYGRGGGAGPI